MAFERYMTRRPVVDIEHKREAIWQDSASCREADPRIFEIISIDPWGTDEEAAEVTKKNLTNFADAESYCDRCPVFEQCLTSTSTEDSKWLLRAGVRPGIYKQKTPSKAKEFPTTCPMGHEGEIKEYPSGQRRCLACRREREHKGEAWVADPEKPCKRGHKDGWKPRKTTGGWFCSTCNAEDGRASRARRKAALSGAADKVEE